jgi:uncharacterized protein (DUF433 family)
MLAAGATEREIRGAYPSIKSSHIKAALNFASKVTNREYKRIPT